MSHHTDFPTGTWDGASETREVPSDVIRSPDAADWARIVDELIATQGFVNDNHNGICYCCVHSIGVHEALTGLTTTEVGNGAIHKTIFDLDDVEMITTDGTTPSSDGAWGNVKLYTFPIGHIQILSASIDFKKNKLVAGDGGISDTADFEIAIGDLAAIQVGQFGLQATEYNLSGAVIDINLIGGKNDTKVSVINGTPFVIDGSAGAKAVYLNLRTLGNDDHSTVADILSMTGEIIINWSYVCAG